MMYPKRGKYIYLNAKDLELLADLLYKDVYLSPSKEGTKRQKDKFKVIEKLLRIEPEQIRRH